MTHNVSFESVAPTGHQLWLSCLAAVIGAAVVLVIAVLPAEFGIDPTGIGARLGLLHLSNPNDGKAVPQFGAKTGMSVSGATSATLDVPAPLPNPEVHQSTAARYRTEVVTITMAPDEELEYKAVLARDQVLLYRWVVDQGEVYFDFHADAPEAPEGFWVRYAEGEASAANGSLVAPFSGNHGWFWQNFNGHPVTITLEVAGYYEALHELGRFNPTTGPRAHAATGAIKQALARSIRSGPTAGITRTPARPALRGSSSPRCAAAVAPPGPSAPVHRRRTATTFRAPRRASPAFVPQAGSVQ
jgi:hypothetical protein